jgi:hypothetical protein
MPLILSHIVELFQFGNSSFWLPCALACTVNIQAVLLSYSTLKTVTMIKLW